MSSLLHNFEKIIKKPKKNETQNKTFFSDYMQDLKDLNCNIYASFSARDIGKSFAWQIESLKNYKQDGSTTALFKRYEIDFKGAKTTGLFDSVWIPDTREGYKHGNIVSEIFEGEWTEVYFRAGDWYLARWDEESGKRILDKRPFCKGFPLSLWEKFKSTSHPDVEMIVFEEFNSRDVWDEEEEYYQYKQMLSTILRSRLPKNGIWLMGNTINQDSIYFKNMLLSHVKEMSPGDIHRYTFRKLYKRLKNGHEVEESQELKICCFWCDKVPEGHANDILFDFDSDKRTEMITSNTWEMNEYPTLRDFKLDYKSSDVIYTYFIKWRDTYIQADIIQKDNKRFTFMHPKKRKFTEDEFMSSIIYSSDYDMNPRHKRNISIPMSNIERKIWNFFVQDKILYSDNNCGDTVDGYLRWCKSHRL